MTRYLTLAEFLAIRASHRVGRFDPGQGRADRPRRLCPACPGRGMGEDDFYPDLHDKAAVLTCRLAWNHPLPDGNKRAAWACLIMFIELNGGDWAPDPPDVDEAEAAMLAVAGARRT